MSNRNPEFVSGQEGSGKRKRSPMMEKVMTRTQYGLAMITPFAPFVSEAAFGNIDEEALKPAERSIVQMVNRDSSYPTEVNGKLNINLEQSEPIPMPIPAEVNVRNIQGGTNASFDKASATLIGYIESAGTPFDTIRSGNWGVFVDANGNQGFANLDIMRVGDDTLEILAQYELSEDGELVAVMSVGAAPTPEGEDDSEEATPSPATPEGVNSENYSGPIRVETPEWSNPNNEQIPLEESVFYQYTNEAEEYAPLPEGFENYTVRSLRGSDTIVAYKPGNPFLGTNEYTLRYDGEQWLNIEAAARERLVAKIAEIEAATGETVTTALPIRAFGSEDYMFVMITDANTLPPLEISNDTNNPVTQHYGIKTMTVDGTEHTFMFTPSEILSMNAAQSLAGLFSPEVRTMASEPNPWEKRLADERYYVDEFTQAGATFTAGEDIVVVYRESRPNLLNDDELYGSAAYGMEVGKDAQGNPIENTLYVYDDGRWEDFNQRDPRLVEFYYNNRVSGLIRFAGTLRLFLSQDIVGNQLANANAYYTLRYGSDEKAIENPEIIGFNFGGMVTVSGATEETVNDYLTVTPVSNSN